MSSFTEPRFNNDDAARAYLETLRWPDGPICPHCGTINRAYAIKPAGTYRCAEPACRGNFTVTMNSPMERSHIALHKWVLAFHLMCSSKKGISAHQLHRTLGITYRSAWFMAHRIRECMRSGGLLPPMGSGGGRVEMDETFIGRTKGTEKLSTHSLRRKRAVLTLVDRRTRKARSFHLPSASSEEIAPIARANISKEARLITDQGTWYKKLGAEFASHETVDHSKDEYVRGEVTTNTVENYFSVFKRGMRGTYQHCAEKHLHRYLAEFDFRYNHRVRLGVNDGERAAIAVKNADGKRLTYRQPY
jgi:transposase-like protein